MVQQQFLFKIFSVAAYFQTVLGSAINEADVCANTKLGVIGGRKILVREAPYIAEAYYQSLSGKWKKLCGASIIHERFVLTAAHCLNYINDISQLYNSKPAMRVVIGSNRLDIRGRTIDVEKEICHEEYDDDFNKNDICLLKLKIPVPFGRRVAKIQLPDEDFELEAGTLVNVTGYGAIGGKENTKGVLRQTSMPIVSDECCRNIYFLVKDKRQICAGSRGLDSREGDSGGPMTYKCMQIGIVSYGEDCTRSNAGVYTRVTSYLKWIHKTVQTNL